MTKSDIKLLLLGVLAYFISTTVGELFFPDSLWKWAVSLVVILILAFFIYTFYAKPRLVDDQRERDERTIQNMNKAGNITLYLTLFIALLMVAFLEVNTQHLRILILISTVIYIGTNIYLNYEK